MAGGNLCRHDRVSAQAKPVASRSPCKTTMIHEALRCPCPARAPHETRSDRVRVNAAETALGDDQGCVRSTVVELGRLLLNSVWSDPDSDPDPDPDADTEQESAHAEFCNRRTRTGTNKRRNGRASRTLASRAGGFIARYPKGCEFTTKYRYFAKYRQSVSGVNGILNAVSERVYEERASWHESCSLGTG